MRTMELAIERGLARACRRVRDESPRGREILAAIQGRRLAVVVSGLPWPQPPIVIECTGDALRLHSGVDARAPDATLTGAPLSLLALTGADPQAVIRRGEVRVEGDAQLVQRMHELVPLMAPDLEHELASVFGRSGAHVLALAMRTAAGGVRRAAWTSVQNLAEYFSHETGDLVSRHEAESFLRGVEQAREQLDRLEARLARLERYRPGPA
ncbi:MAG: ubiquinone biosynthesis accessory factor UbiJ [Steroidobacteraceae bacterium]